MSGYRAPSLPLSASARLRASLVLVSLVLAANPRGALAEPMSPALEGLTIESDCGASRGRPCRPDRGGFERLVAQYGGAVMPPWATAARTLGSRGFQLGFQVSHTSVDRAARYWKQGTRAGQGGHRLDRGLGLYALTASKGLGFGLQAAGLAGKVGSTGMAMFGARLQFAPFEGWDVGPYAWLPDVAVALSGWGSTGASQLSLSGTDWELRVSKPLPSRSGWHLSPWLGLSRLRVGGVSRRVDLTPAEDALADCVYRGPALPGASVRSGELPPLDGSPLCAVGDASAFDDSVEFGRARSLRHRIVLGLGLRTQWLAAALQFGFEPRSPASSQSSAQTEAVLACRAAAAECSPSRRQWSAVLSLVLGL